MRTAQCTGAYSKIPLICWKFDADIVSAASAQNTCNADSGGGIFMRDDDGDRVVEKVFGVVSGGTDPSCMKKDLSFNVDVSKFRNWIETAGEGRLSSAVCGRSLWTQREEPKRATLVVEQSQDEANFEIDVPEQVKSMRVSLNAEDNGKGANAFALSVDSGEDDIARDACQGSPHFATCDVPTPRAGLWRVKIKRQKGHGQIQVTAVVQK